MEEDDEIVDVYHSISKYGEMRPCQILFFFRHQVEVLGENGNLDNVTHTFAFVRYVQSKTTKKKKQKKN